MDELIACNLSRPDLSRQRGRWLELAGRTRVERAELPNGLRLVFAEAPGVEDRLEELVAVERECCSFADWDLIAGGGAVTLEITARGDAIGVLHGMFSQLQPA
jgi:hypothetical protein